MTNEALFRQYRTGESIAAEHLVYQMEKFIYSVAVSCAADFSCLQSAGPEGSYTAYTDELLKELCAEGTLALLEQLQSDGYDESKGKLTTWLYPHIKYAMYRWLERNIGAVSLSKDEMGMVRRAQRLFHGEGRDTTVIAAELGISETDAARHIGYNTHTLFIGDFAENADGESTDPFDVLPFPAAAPADRVVYKKVSLELLRELFDSLGEKDRSIIGHSYGVYGYEKLTLDELALRELMKPDGIVKARKAGLGRLREKYKTSRLRVWRWAHRIFPRW